MIKKPLLAHCTFIFFVAISHLTLSAFADSRLGRLFTTPAEREKLDEIRVELLYGSDIKTIEVASPEPGPAPEKNKSKNLVFSGYVFREDGKHMVWVDGKSKLSSSKMADGVKVSSPKKNNPRVPLRYENKMRSLKPGQVWQVESGQVLEGFNFREREKSARSERANVPLPISNSLETLKTLQEYRDSAEIDGLR